jgi:hypothetical protein
MKSIEIVRVLWIDGQALVQAQISEYPNPEVEI